MSCQILDDHIYNAIANTITKESSYGHNVRRLGGEQEARDLVLRIRAINFAAYNERYPDARVDFEEINAQDGGDIVTTAQLFKYLQSADYQCSDCALYNESRTRETWRGLMLSVAEQILRDVPAYEKAQWS